MQPCLSYLALFLVLPPMAEQNQLDGSLGLKRGVQVRGNRVSYGNFAVDKFHRLQVSVCSLIVVSNYRECALGCVNTTPCSSFNVAATAVHADGKYQCELLNEDKYSVNPGLLVISQEHHHYSIKTPCSSFPCQNGAKCIPNYSKNQYYCDCTPGYNGKYCETVFKSCQDVYDISKSNQDQLVTLFLGSTMTTVYCHMGDFGCGDGGWTPVMKMDGSKSTFHYNSAYWSNTDSYSAPAWKTGFDAQEAKLPTYWNTPFTKICLGMKIGQQIKFVVISKQASSLHSLIADGQRRLTSLGRDSWISLMGPYASLQSGCNREGFNILSDDTSMAKARIGIIGNNENDCTSCDSRIGFGTGGRHNDASTCGNQDKTAIGYILVQ